MKRLLSLILIIFFWGCDSYEEAGISNNTDQEIAFITIGFPAAIKTGNAILVQQIDEKYFYKLASESYDAIMQEVNGTVEPKNILFDTLIVINQSDTIYFNSPQEIFDAMTKKGKYDYEIQVN